MWVECGKPRTGVVYDIMRQTRARYHYAIRYARRHENDIINDRFANALLLNSRRDFWSEVKKIRRSGSCVSGAVDGVSNASDIASLFARKYEDLYTSVAYDPVVMKQISQELNSSLESTGYDGDCIVDMSDVLGAIGKLKLGKSDGNGVLSTDYFKHAGPELSVHIAMLLNALVIHGCTPADLVTSTIIPIPKGRGVNITDSAITEE